MATREDPATAGCPSGRWSLDDLALAILKEARQDERLMARMASFQAAARDAGGIGEQWQAARLALTAEGGAVPMSRSTIWRILDRADLKPHRSTYWLTSHDPGFWAKAQHICRLYLDAPRLWQQDGELVLCTDEKTGILIRRRKHPTLPILPGLPARREHEYKRLGGIHLSASFAVPTGQVAHDLTQTHNGSDFVAHLLHAVKEMPQAQRYHWVVDNNRTHSTPGVCAAVAQMSGIALPASGLATAKERRAWLSDPSHKHVFHFTPVHGSWLNQVEMFFSVLSRKLLSRDDFPSAEAFHERLHAWMAWYNEEWAHPYQWTYAGTPLVRGTPFERTRRQQMRGQAFCGTRPKFHQRLFYPSRPCRKKAAAA